MTNEKLKNDAAVMVIASKALEVMAVTGLNTCEDEKMGEFLAHVMSPALILRAFSCELILKSLAAKTHNISNNSHKSNDLYHTVDDSTKDAIKDSVISKIQVHQPAYGTSDFLLDLDNIANIFADWWCFYENPRSLNTAFFEAFFDELVKYTFFTEKKA